MSSKKPFGEDAKKFVRFCNEQGIPHERISVALVQLGFEARAVSAALETELPRRAESEDEMEALVAITMKMHTPGWKVSLTTARSAAIAALSTVRERLPAGTRKYVTSALAVSAIVLLLGWTSAAWLIQPPSHGKAHVTAQAKPAPAGKKKQFTFWSLPSRN